jgi:hypothetical protein
VCTKSPEDLLGDGFTAACVQVPEKLCRHHVSGCRAKQIVPVDRLVEARRNQLLSFRAGTYSCTGK